MERGYRVALRGCSAMQLGLACGGMDVVKDVWDEGDSYEPYCGRWSRLTAHAFLEWLDARPGLRWLDVGCGTGALSHGILDRKGPEGLLGVDRSSGYIRHARGGASALARFVVGDAQALPVAAGQFDIAVSSLVLNFVPQPDRMIQEMVRAVQPSGQIALYVWDYAGKMELMRYFWDAAVELNPEASGFDEGKRFPICQPNALRELMMRSGVSQVDVQAIDVPTVFRDFDDYWSPFLQGQGPAPGYAVSLPESARRQLRERVRSRLPEAPDGSISLIARAWAVRGLAGPPSGRV